MSVPHRPSLALLAIAPLAFSLTACGDTSRIEARADEGPQPQLVEPKKSLIPTLNIAPARGWAEGGKPVAAAGLEVHAFATGLDHPRWVHTLPNGDVLVVESNGPKRAAGLNPRKIVQNMVMKRAGSATESANRITLLRDVDGDGEAETRSEFLTGLNSPFGVALIGNDLYVANTDAVLRFPYTTGQMRITVPGQKLAALPAGEVNHHWTKNIIASEDGTKIYATTGSNSNVAENGMENEVNRAAILEIDVASGATRVFASGLRNPNGMAWQPQSRQLWTVVNERDELGSDLVPDYLTSVQDGGFYGWPYSWFGQHIDDRVDPQNPELVARAIVPDYALGAHTASLGLMFYTADLLPQYRNGAIIGQHGSWNRKPHSGYKVVYVPFENGKPSGPSQDVLTGFLSEDGEAYGRPVGVTADGKGALLVADDVGNVIWRVKAAGTK
ncbi:sorbosone dehydrogenase [Oxalicibacterium flavum]|uniref:Sorbosone dehydrogenase n=1 Tax=Oxalicibacterium flavum TaxID=179467 RepID=A0A8J2XZK7_9BURK|nr:sorbosone dehydrogenase family protein [Oxalicibacterium flavum]GGC12206.1 sorbosone dehydrogenase [Oxalicibacterium flavum]